ncbi:MAG: M48 family metallopeptidase [Thermoleophilia bacterium]
MVCVTRGLLQQLETHELEGVVAHELAHLANRDGLLMTAAWFLPLVSALVTAFGAAFLAVRARGWIGLMLWITGIAFVAIGVMCLLVSLLIVMGLSRVREYAADRYAAELTGRPRALASALTSISRAPTTANPKLVALSGLLFFNPTAGFLHTLFATHPPPDKRIARLTALADRMEGPAPATGPAAPVPQRVAPNGVVGDIHAEVAASPTRSLTVNAFDLAHRFGSKATKRLPRQTLDRATAELRQGGIAASEVAGPAGPLIRLTLLGPPPAQLAPATTCGTARRPPRTLSGVIFGGGILGGAALGVLLLIAMITSSGAPDNATASPQTTSPPPVASGEDPCGAGNGETDPPVILGTNLEASPTEILVRLHWCDDTDTYSADAVLTLTGPARHILTKTLPPRIQPGTSLIRFNRRIGGAADGVKAGRYQYEVALIDLDDQRTTSPPGSIKIPAKPPQPVRALAPATPPPVVPVVPVVPVAPAAACDPNYAGACVPPYPPDVDCSQIPASNFAVIGWDPHGFDSDADGIACEG